MGTLVKTNGNLFPTVPTFFDDLFTRDLFNRSNQNNGDALPAVNIRETATSYELEVAAPGMSKEDFKVELDKDTLIISAQKASESEDTEGTYTRREFNYQSMKRSFSLPQRMVEGDKIVAKYNDGILHITVPKTDEAKVKPSRLIQIS